MPVNGYTAFFEKLLNQANIDIQLNTDIFDRIAVDTDNNVFLFDNEVLDVPFLYSGGCR